MSARTEVGAVVRVVVVLLVLGVLLGVGWALLAPGLPVGIRASDGAVLVLSPESRSRFAPSGYFAVASLVLGVLAGAATWLWRRWRGPAVLAALVLGAAAAALVALAVGDRVARLRFPVAQAAAGSTTTAPPELGTWTLALVLPVGAVLAYTLAVSLSRADDPRGGLSSTPAAPAAAPAAGAPPATP